MATVAKKMYRAQPTTSSATLYTAPSTGAIVTNIVITNTSTTTAAAATVAFGGTTNALLSAISVPASTTVTFDMKQVMANAETLTGLANPATLTFHISGVEL